MLKKTCLLSLFSIAALGFVSVPTLAQQTSGQTGSQTAVIQGDNNTIIQNIYNTSIQQQNRGKKPHQNQGSAQNSHTDRQHKTGYGNYINKVDEGHDFESQTTHPRKH